MANIRILLIEDDPSYARLIERMLAMSPVGFKVTSADTLQDARKALSESNFNLVLTVLDLPDVKGLDTLAAVRSAGSTIPIVVLTGQNDANLEKRAIALGAQFCLRKSNIHTQSLLNAMHQAVRATRQRSDSTSDKRVDRLLSDLEENIVAIKDAAAILDYQRHDEPQRDAVDAIRSHIGTMQEKIGRYRRPER